MTSCQRCQTGLDAEQRAHARTQRARQRQRETTVKSWQGQSHLNLLMPALYILQHTSTNTYTNIHLNLYPIQRDLNTHSLVHACAHSAACEHTRSVTLFCQSSGCAATYSILIIVRGRSDSHQRSLPIKLHGLCSINDRLHTST